MTTRSKLTRAARLTSALLSATLMMACADTEVDSTPGAVLEPSHAALGGVAQPEQGSPPTYTLHGRVRQELDQRFRGDGIGDLFLSVGAACNGPTAVAGMVVIDADLSDLGAELDFTIPHVPEGGWYITAWLDDNGNGMLDEGDFGQRGGAACAWVEVDSDLWSGPELIFETVVE
jgi:hypothetical protein